MQAAARITGYSSDEVIGRSCHILEGTNCKGFSKLTEFLREPDTLSVGNLQSGMQGIGRRTVKELYLYGNVSVLRDERGTVVGAVGTFTDLTSFILAKEKIQVSGRTGSVQRFHFSK